MREGVVAQLVEWLHPTPEVRCSNQVNGEFLNNIYLLSAVLIRRK